MRLRLAVLVPLFLAAACSDSHPLQGGWSQQLPGDKAGAFVEFSSKDERALAHGPEREGGGHGHASGTYTFDAKTGALSVTWSKSCEGVEGTWQGKLTGDAIEFTAGEQKLSFRRGGAAQGH